MPAESASPAGDGRGRWAGPCLEACDRADLALEELHSVAGAAPAAFRDSFRAPVRDDFDRADDWLQRLISAASRASSALAAPALAPGWPVQGVPEPRQNSTFIRCGLEDFLRTWENERTEADLPPHCKNTAAGPRVIGVWGTIPSAIQNMLLGPVEFARQDLQAFRRQAEVRLLAGESVVPQQALAKSNAMPVPHFPARGAARKILDELHAAMGQLVLVADLEKASKAKNVPATISQLRKDYGWQPENGYRIENEKEAVESGYDGPNRNRRAYRLVKLAK